MISFLDYAFILIQKQEKKNYSKKECIRNNIYFFLLNLRIINGIKRESNLKERHLFCWLRLFETLIEDNLILQPSYIKYQMSFITYTLVCFKKMLK